MQSRPLAPDDRNAITPSLIGAVTKLSSMLTVACIQLQQFWQVLRGTYKVPLRRLARLYDRRPRSGISAVARGNRQPQRRHRKVETIAIVTGGGASGSPLSCVKNLD